MNSFDLRHPDAGLLLSYLDGELPARQVRRIRQHVEACWQCRTEIDELQKTVGECVRYRREMLGSGMPPPPRPWADLERGFAQVDASLERRPLLARPPVRWAAALGAVASLVVAATLTLERTSFRQATPASVAAPKPALPVLPRSPASTTMTRTDGAPPPSAPGRAPKKSEDTPSPAGVGDELQAVAALHQLGADLGDPVEVTRDGPHVIITGTGISADRQDQIRGRLASLPKVVLRFSEPPQIAEALPSGPANDSVNSLAPSTPNPLEAQLGGRAELERFSSRLLDRTDAAMARVYALHRLAQQFPTETEQQLKPEEQKLLHGLAREHVQALASQVQDMNRLLTPVLPSLGATASSSPASSQVSTWQAAAGNLFRSARQSDALLAAFLGASAPEKSGDNPVQRLTIVLAQFQADVQQCDLLLSH